MTKTANNASFNPATLIKKKRSGLPLSADEIAFLVNGFTQGEIPDYQMSAFLMAVYFKGMSTDETASLVDIMEHSGEVADLSKIKFPKVDKHSTGGIGDKTSLILAPLLASCGAAYPTIAGRGLGHTGGTVDKFEAIPGFDCTMTLARFKELVATVGLAFIGQTEELCPADRKLYALRDVTATVESIPLIVASIMSKKLAEGIDGLVFDVKVGSGAFMKTKGEAMELAKSLVATGEAAGKKARALLTDMSQPLGRAVGNAIEVNECVAFLRQGPQDAKPDERLKEVTMALAVELLQLAEEIKGGKISAGVAQEVLEESISSGKAYAKFLEIISLQGGDTEALDQGLPLAPKKISFTASRKGFITGMDAEKIGMALVDMGGGRRKTSDKIDFGVGFEFHKFIGDAVKPGEAVATIYARDAKSGEAAAAALEAAVNIGSEAVSPPKLVIARV